jgi:ABC-2 type transport system permease protein
MTTVMSPPNRRAGTTVPSVITLTRLVRVEARKMSDTRSGKWLLIGLAIMTLAIVSIFFATADPSDRTFIKFMAATLGPQGFLLPVLGILLITSEWSQRTGLVSFTLVPVRGRVLLAKVLAGTLVAVAALGLSMIVAAIATVAGGADGAWTGVGLSDVGGFAILQLTGIIQGFAFGLLFLASNRAIASYFVFPTAFNILGTYWTPLGDVQPWIDLWTAQTPLFTGGTLSGEQWAQVGTTNLIWVVLPLALGLLRVLRSEVK